MGKMKERTLILALSNVSSALLKQGPWGREDTTKKNQVLLPERSPGL